MNIKPWIGKFSGTWKLLMHEYGRKSMIISEKKADFQRLNGWLTFWTGIRRFHWNQGNNVAHFTWFGEPWHIFYRQEIKQSKKTKLLWFKIIMKLTIFLYIIQSMLLCTKRILKIHMYLLFKDLFSKVNILQINLEPLSCSYHSDFTHSSLNDRNICHFKEKKI